MKQNQVSEGFISNFNSTTSRRSVHFFSLIRRSYHCHILSSCLAQPSRYPPNNHSMPFIITSKDSDKKKTAPSHRAWNSARTAWADLHPDTWPVTPPAQRSGKGRRMITRPDREVEPEKQTWIAHLTLKTWWRLSCFGCQNSRWCFNDRSQWKQEREKNKNQTASNCIYPS